MLGPAPAREASRATGEKTAIRSALRIALGGRPRGFGLAWAVGVPPSFSTMLEPMYLILRSTYDTGGVLTETSSKPSSVIRQRSEWGEKCERCRGNSRPNQY